MPAPGKASTRVGKGNGYAEGAGEGAWDAAGPAIWAGPRGADGGAAARAGQPTGEVATWAAMAGETRTTPANSLPRSTGTICTSAPVCGAWIISPLPR